MQISRAEKKYIKIFHWIPGILQHFFQNLTFECSNKFFEWEAIFSAFLEASWWILYNKLSKWHPFGTDQKAGNHSEFPFAVFLQGFIGIEGRRPWTCTIVHQKALQTQSDLLLLSKSSKFLLNAKYQWDVNKEGIKGCMSAGGMEKEKRE